MRTDTPRSLEYREVDAAVDAAVDKAFVGAEVVVLAVFEDKDAAVGQKAFIKDKLGYLGQFLQRVWRVGKDEVELLAA